MIGSRTIAVLGLTLLYSAYSFAGNSVHFQCISSLNPDLVRMQIQGDIEYGYRGKTETESLSFSYLLIQDNIIQDRGTAVSQFDLPLRSASYNGSAYSDLHSQFPGDGFPFVLLFSTDWQTANLKMGNAEFQLSCNFPQSPSPVPSPVPQPSCSFGYWVPGVGCEHPGH